MKSRPVPPPLGTATLQKSSDAQGNLVKPVLGFRRGKKELLENEQSRQNVVLDQGRYGEFIFKVRKLITEPSPTNPKTQLKKNPLHHSNFHEFFHARQTRTILKLQIMNLNSVSQLEKFHP